MQLLPDLVAAEPMVVFCGVAGLGLKPRQHYYETPGNSFWESLHLAGFTSERLAPAEDHRVVELGLGLTDLEAYLEDRPGDRAGTDPRHRFDVDGLGRRLARWRPEWVAFTSKTAAHAAARELGCRRPGLGPADLYVGGVQAFVLPGVSGANRRHDYDGRPPASRGGATSRPSAASTADPRRDGPGNLRRRVAPGATPAYGSPHLVVTPV